MAGHLSAPVAQASPKGDDVKAGTSGSITNSAWIWVNYNDLTALPHWE